MPALAGVRLHLSEGDHHFICQPEVSALDLARAAAQHLRVSEGSQQLPWRASTQSEAAQTRGAPSGCGYGAASLKAESDASSSTLTRCSPSICSKWGQAACTWTCGRAWR
ncbi:unnamed protein product [Effrenium voratum]|nr:unnamed protein product [Effrenium voratum]